MSIELWAARLERPLTAAEEAALTELLPPRRRRRLTQTRPENRREPLCAYALLRHALELRQGWRRWPEMALSPLGKPCFPDHPTVQFSLSHTQGAVLAGLWDCPLGVDIERVRPLRPGQMERLTGARSEAEFFRGWVRREARSKRTGEGVRAFLRGEAPMEEAEAYWEIETFPGYAAGVSAGAGELPPSVRRLTLGELLERVL